MAKFERNSGRGAAVSKTPEDSPPSVIWLMLTEHDRFVCWGPAKPPMEMTANDHARWHGHLTTPVIFNHHTPVEVNSTSISHVNLNPIKSTPQGLLKRERVLILTPLRNAANHLFDYFDLLSQLTYPHELIDLAFLVGDSTDDTVALLAAELDRVQQRTDNVPFRSAMIVEKDFGVKLSQNVEDRHGFAAQGPRRKTMGRARNYLLSAALKPEHSWVYWRDVDIQDSPSKIIEDLILHDRDILVPNIWFHRYEEKDGKMRDIEGRCKWLIILLGDAVAHSSQSITIHGKSRKTESYCVPL